MRGCRQRWPCRMPDLARIRPHPAKGAWTWEWSQDRNPRRYPPSTLAVASKAFSVLFTLMQVFTANWALFYRWCARDNDLILFHLPFWVFLSLSMINGASLTSCLGAFCNRREKEWVSIRAMEMKQTGKINSQPNFAHPATDLALFAVSKKKFNYNIVQYIPRFKHLWPKVYVSCS